MERGQKIADKKGHVKSRAHNRYDVRSQSGESATYEVRFTATGPSCECPDHQYRKTACRHIIAVIQRNSDSARDKASASAPDAKCAPDPGAKRGEPVQADEPTASDPATGIDVGGSKPGKPGKASKQGKDTGEAAGSRIFEITKEKAVARLTAIFPGMDIPGMSKMRPKDALVAMHDAFGRLAALSKI